VLYGELRQYLGEADQSVLHHPGINFRGKSSAGAEAISLHKSREPFARLAWLRRRGGAQPPGRRDAGGGDVMLARRAACGAPPLSRKAMQAVINHAGPGLALTRPRPTPQPSCGICFLTRPACLNERDQPPHRLRWPCWTAAQGRPRIVAVAGPNILSPALRWVHSGYRFSHHGSVRHWAMSEVLDFIGY
jgi:hypothetical protein